MVVLLLFSTFVVLFLPNLLVGITEPTDVSPTEVQLYLPLFACTPSFQEFPWFAG